MSDLIILDPGFSDFYTHHWAVNSRFFPVKGFGAVQVLASLALEQSEFDVLDTLLCDAIIPWFKTPCYTDGLKSLSLDKENMFSDLFAEEIRTAFHEKIIGTNSHLLIHTGFSFHFLGLAKFLLRVGPAFQGKILVCGMFHPGHIDAHGLVQCNDWNGYCRYQQAFWALKMTAQFAVQQILLATNSQSYQVAYQSLWPTPVLIHPIVNYVPPLPVRKQQTKKTNVLLYLGSVKRDKGLQFILDVIQDICLEFPNMDFLLHLNPLSPGIRDFPDAINCLSRLQSSVNNFVLIAAGLSQRDYENLLGKIDCLVLAYDPEIYHCKTSGLFWDAMRYPKIILLHSKGLWVDSELGRFQGDNNVGLSFEYLSKLELIESLKSAKQRFDQGVSNAFSPYAESLLSPFPEWVWRQML